MHQFTQQYLLITYYEPGTLSDTRDALVKNIDKSPTAMEFRVRGWGARGEQRQIINTNHKHNK